MKLASKLVGIGALMLFAFSSAKAQQLELSEKEKVLAVELTAIHCVFAYLSQMIDEDKDIEDLPFGHPIFYWRHLADSSAKVAGRDWYKDAELLRHARLSRQNLLGRDFVAKEDSILIESCAELQAVLETKDVRN